MAQTLACTVMGSILWAAACHSLTFSGDGAFIGALDRVFLRNIGMETTSPLAATIPEILFMAYQMTFAVITVALVAGSVTDRMRFSAFVWFAILWLPIVYVPIAHWVWGNGWLMKLGVLDFAGGTVVHVQCGRRGPRRRLRGRQTCGIWQREFRALRSVTGGDRGRVPLGRDKRGYDAGGSAARLIDSRSSL
jgi:Amt family ammonium transporter